MYRKYFSLWHETDEGSFYINTLGSGGAIALAIESFCNFIEARKYCCFDCGTPLAQNQVVCPRCGMNQETRKEEK